MRGAFRVARIGFGSTAFDIEATAGRSVSPDQLKSMLGSLLADRFKLSMREETKVSSVYELVLARRDGRIGSNTERSGHQTNVLGRLPDAQSNRANIQGLLALTSCYFFHVVRTQVSCLGYADNGNAVMERLIEMGPQIRPVFLKPYIAIDEDGINGWQNA